VKGANTGAKFITVDKVCHRSELSKYARYPTAVYIVPNIGPITCPTLCWAEQEPDGTIVADTAKYLVVGAYPPLITYEPETRTLRLRWMHENYRIVPRLEVIEPYKAEGDYAIVRRNDGVKFKLVGLIAFLATIPLELIKRYGLRELRLHEVLVRSYEAAREAYPRFVNMEERAEGFIYAIVNALGILYYETALIDLE